MTSRRNRQPSPRRSRKVLVIAIMVAVTACAAVGVVIWRQWDQAITTLPTLSTTHLSASRQEQLTRQRQDVLAHRTDPNAWGKYGMLLLAFDFNSAAADCFRRAEALEPGNPRWPYYAALASRSDDPAAYARDLNRAVELAGNEPPIPRYYLARVFAEEGRWQEAQSHGGALIAAHPTFHPARLLLAQVAVAQGDTAAAAELALKTLDDPRTRKAASALLSSIRQREGNSSAARELAALSAAAPADQPVFDPWEADISSLRGDPRRLTSHVHKLLAARQLTEAASLVDQLVREHPGFDETWLVRGRLSFLQKDFPAAEAALRKHLQMNPTSVQGLFQLGTVLLNAGNLPASADAFREATKLKPDFGPAWFNLGVALGRAGQGQQAADALQEAVRLNPEHIDSYLLLADLHMQRGDKARAAALLEEAGRINAADPKLTAFRNRLSTR